MQESHQLYPCKISLTARSCPPLKKALPNTFRGRTVHFIVIASAHQHSGRKFEIACKLELLEDMCCAKRVEKLAFREALQVGRK